MPPFRPRPHVTEGGLSWDQAVLRAGIAQLKAAREAAGLSLTDAARLAGMAPESLSRLETGAAANPTWKTLARVAGAVGCQLTLTVEPHSPQGQN